MSLGGWRAINSSYTKLTQLKDAKIDIYDIHQQYYYRGAS